MPLQSSLSSGSLSNIEHIISELPSLDTIKKDLQYAWDKISANSYREAFVILNRLAHVVKLSDLKQEVVEHIEDNEWKAAFSEVFWRLGKCHLLGHGTPKDLNSALQCFSKSTLLHVSGDNLYLSGVSKENLDPHGAKSLFKRGVEEFGHPECCYRLGLSLLLHDKNEEEAVSLFKTSMEKGSANGLYAMAIAYERGQGGINKDEELALKCFMDAAEKGSVDAMSMLYKIYSTGRLGQSKNNRMAESYARLGSEYNHAKSKFNLGAMLSKSDPFRAAIYFQEANILGHDATLCRNKQSHLRFKSKSPYSKTPYTITFSEASLVHRFFGTLYKGKYCGKNVLIRFINHSVLGIPVRDLEAKLQAETLQINKIAGPHNAKVLSYYADESFLVVIYDQFESDLNTYLYTQTSLTTRQRINIIGQIASGMHHLHNNIMTHASLTCGAVGIMPSGRVKVLGAQNFLTGSLFERIDDPKDNLYAAPEVVKGDKPNIRSDIYSFGLVAYKVMIGSLPKQILDTLSKNEEEDEASPVQQINEVKDSQPSKNDLLITQDPHFSSLPGNIQNLLSGCLNPVPELRYASFEEICNVV